MKLLLGKLRVNDLITIQKRFRNPDHHWSIMQKKVFPKDKALKHFDEFYQNVYGDYWQHMRAALLHPTSKYMAVVNNFGDTEATIQKLQLLGAINVKDIYESQKKNLSFRNARRKATNETDDVEIDQKMRGLAAKEQDAELRSIYPDDYEPPQFSLEEESEPVDRRKIEQPLSQVQMKSLEEGATEDSCDHGRIIPKDVRLSSSSLHEYVPATKIKGMDDFILESEHYKFYDRGSDFSVNIEKDPVLKFPEHLKVYTFEAQSDNRFPSPKPGVGGLYNYYLLDGASILPVLALDLQPGDVVLDMCAAPGGKSFVALQTLMPRVLVANDIKVKRVQRIHDVIDEYFFPNNWENRLFVTNQDARHMEEENMFNKILVDVPCTTDRHVLHEDDNNIFKSMRTRERIELPEIQTEILSKALKLVAPGGIVVYSTCTLSPVQNDGVVQMALKKNWEETQSVMVVMDMMEALEPLRCLYKFGNFALKHGHIVLPTKSNNWGPMYFCKIKRCR